MKTFQLNASSVIRIPQQAPQTVLPNESVGKNQLAMPVVLEMSGAGTIGAGTDVALCDGAGGAFAPVIPLAAATKRGSTLFIKKTDVTANAITPTSQGSDTIDGGTTIADLDTPGAAALLWCDGVSKWYQVS